MIGNSIFFSLENKNRNNEIVLVFRSDKKRLWWKVGIKGWLVEKSVEKWGLWDTAGGEERWQAPREADSNMQLSRVKLSSAEQMSLVDSNMLNEVQQSTVKLTKSKLSSVEQSSWQQYTVQISTLKISRAEQSSWQQYTPQSKYSKASRVRFSSV